jgi:hypothetical protein
LSHPFSVKDDLGQGYALLAIFILNGFLQDRIKKEKGGGRQNWGLDKSAFLRDLYFVPLAKTLLE